MSRAFTKEDATPQEPLVPARRPLPPETPNYVTPRGLEALRREHRELLEERVRADAEPTSDSTHARVSLQARVGELEARLASAVLVDGAGAPRDVIRFGARVSVRGESGPIRVYEIVGVDEADAAQGRIAFVAPIARALLGKRAGDTVALRSPGGEEELEILAIE